MVGPLSAIAPTSSVDASKTGAARPDEPSSRSAVVIA
jgi:hypothetical protein